MRRKDIYEYDSEGLIIGRKRKELSKNKFDQIDELRKRNKVTY